MPDPAPVFAEVKLKESPASGPTLPVQSAAPVASQPVVVERKAPGIEIDLKGGRRVRFDRETDPEAIRAAVRQARMPAPPAEESGKLEDGRRFLTLGFGGKPTADLLRATQVLILRVDRETAWGDLLPVLAGAVVRCPGGLWRLA